MTRLTRFVLAALALLFTGSAASAETLLMPKRDAIKGTPIVVWGISTLPNGTAFSIDYGDGTANTVGTVGDRSYIAFQHTFPSAGNKTVTLTVGAESTTVNVQVFDSALLTADNLRSLKINLAIQDGLRHLWTTQTNRTTFDTNAQTSWNDGTWTSSYTSLVALAFENHGYKLPNNNGPITGLYQKYLVRRAINYVVASFSTFTIASQPSGFAGQPVRDPCVGTGVEASPCVALRDTRHDTFHESYTTGVAVLALAGSGALSRQNTEVAGYTFNKTYGEILQRAVNALAWGQSDVNSLSRGGWYYNFNNSSSDGSTVGWDILAMLDASAAGAVVPAWVASEFAFSLAGSITTNGSFNYQSSGGENSPGPQKVGIGLQGLFLTGELTGARVTAVTNNLNSWWNGGPGIGQNPWGCGQNGNTNKGCAYSMFNNFKGLKLHGIQTLPNVTRPAGPGTQPAGDWYADYQDWLVANQSAPNTVGGGSWGGVMAFSCCDSANSAKNAIAELILSPVALVLPDEDKFSTVGLTPLTNTAMVGSAHTVTAHAESTGGTAVPGATVVFTILSGPHAGQTGSATTNSSGNATFTYTGTNYGLDTIRASIGTLNSNTVTATWIAPTTTVVTCPATVFYNGAPQTPCTAVASDAFGFSAAVPVAYTANVDSGVVTASAAYAGDAFHTGSNGSATFEILPVATTTVVTCPPSVVYDGTAQTPCVAVATGPGVNESLAVTYSANINVGTVTASASYAGDMNHLASSGSATFEITPAPTVTVVSCPASVVYNGAAQEVCSATVTGPGGLNDALVVSYADNVNVGTATASASYAGGGNYLASSDSETFEITPAPTVTVVSCPASVVYNGLAQAVCTATVTGPGGLNEAVAVTYANNVNVGTATASASYAGGGNYLASSDSTTFEITPAPTVTVVTCPASVVYNGAAQTVCAATVTGVGLNETLAVTYANNVNVGTATASASYAGDANHSASSGSATFEITPAPSVTVVSCPPSVVYNGAAQTVCTATVTGVGGLSESVDVTYTDNVNVGTATASATYAGDANHSGSSASATFEITQAPTSTSVTAPTITYAANGVVTVSVSSTAGTVVGNVQLTVDGGAPLTAALVGGSATFTLASPNAGDHALVATYAAQGNFAGSTAAGNLHVNPSPTATTLVKSPAAPTAQGATVTLTATVVSVAPGSGTPNGTVTFRNGTTVLGTAALNGAGVAVLNTTALPIGNASITATYDGVNNYLTSASSAVSHLVFGWGTGTGTFVIGNLNANLGQSVTYWGAQWAKVNGLSGGAAPSSFKGFAASIAPAPSAAVGKTWTSRPGASNTSEPTSVPAYMGIIVASSVTKSGSTEAGNIVKIVVIQTAPGYGNAPGHTGTGTIVAVLP